MPTSIENPTQPLQQVIPSYLYQQYADDENIQALVDAYNTLAQSYLDWFNQNPFGVYTSPSVSGQLLDWIGLGVYGIARPVFSTLATHYLTDAVNMLPTNTIVTDGSKHSASGTTVTANDDFYKRTITWATYIGDGRTCSATVLRKRIARFLYGVNGGDISLAQTQSVHLVAQTGPLNYAITIPSAANPASSYFKDAFEAGLLAFPFQLAATVTIA